MNKFLVAAQIAGIIVGWLTRAAGDGKITVPEILELMQDIVDIWGAATGKPIEIDLGVNAVPDPHPLNRSGE